MTMGALLGSIFATLLSLALVIGLAFGLLWLLRRMQDRQAGAEQGAGEDRRMRFERALPLGQRERLVMVRVGGDRMLLGVTAGGISLIARWDAADDDPPPLEPALEPALGPAGTP